jgi:hypothetical protein
MSSPAAPGPAGQGPAGPRPPRPRLCQTLHEVIEAYLRFAEGELAPSTYRIRRGELALFDRDCGQLTFDECRPWDLLHFLSRQQTLRSEWSRRRVLAGIKRAFNWALEMELVPRNPFARVRSRGRLPCQREPMSAATFQTLLRHSPRGFGSCSCS